MDAVVKIKSGVVVAEGKGEREGGIMDVVSVSIRLLRVNVFFECTACFFIAFPQRLSSDVIGSS